MGEDGVIGKIAATSVKAYETYAAALFPSMVLKDVFFAMLYLPL
jgi:hypothetical protein